MKTAIYSTAFGKDIYYLLANEMCKSLKKVGYDGDIFILTDKEFNFENANNIVVKNKIDLDEKILNAIPIPENSKILYKAYLPNKINIENYEKILFVDSDVIFIKNPKPIFDLSKNDTNIYLSYEPSNPLKKHFFNLKYFTYNERKEVIKTEFPSLNTGIILFPTEIMKEVCRLWQDEWLRLSKGKYERWDQSVMQILTFRDKIKYNLISPDLYSYKILKRLGTVENDNTVAFHLCGRDENNKLSVLNLMKEINR
jgi:hypothetical protein